MEKYKKVSRTKNAVPKFSFILEDCVHMNVKNGSKINNLIQFAIKKIEDPSVFQMAWWGDDKSITKAIACAERIKSLFSSVLYQITKIFYNSVIEKYEPIDSNSEILEATRNIPSILIVLSKTQFGQIGLQYQTSEMNISNIVYNSSQGHAMKLLKKVKRKQNLSRLQNSVLNKD